MVERVWLHIGLHKTGSTSIQATLADYDDGDCFYAQLGMANHSQPLYTAFSERRNSYHIWTKLGCSTDAIEQERQRVLTVLTEQLGRHDRRSMIISGEDLGHLNHKEVTALLTCLQARGARVSVVAYGREPLAYAVSACQQLIKGGATRIPQPLGQQIEQKLEPYRSLLGDDAMIVRPFDPGNLIGGCVVQDFCRIVGLPSSDLPIKRRNESLSAPAIQVLFHLNRTSPLQFGDAVLVRTRQRLIRVLQQLFAKAPCLDPALCRSRADSRDAEYLAAVHGVRFTASSPAELQPEQEALESWLEAIGPEVSAAIEGWLQQEAGLSCQGASTSEQIHRLFYVCLCRDPLEVHAKLLRRVAERCENDSRVTLEEGVQLLDLACQGKPHRIGMQRRLSTWRQRLA